MAMVFFLIRDDVFVQSYAKTALSHNNNNNAYKICNRKRANIIKNCDIKKKFLSRHVFFFRHSLFVFLGFSVTN